MMVDILTVALGVGLGTTITSIIALTVMLNKRVLKWYTKHITKTSMEIASELLEVNFDNLKDDEDLD